MQPKFDHEMQLTCMLLEFSKLFEAIQISCYDSSDMEIVLGSRESHLWTLFILSGEFRSILDSPETKNFYFVFCFGVGGCLHFFV